MMLLNCQNLWLLLATVLLLQNQHSSSLANQLATRDANEPTEAGGNTDLITDDIIHDEIEKGTKKVIRVNPLDLPPLKQDPNLLNMDSLLYKIQTLKPKRKYTNIQRSKPINGVDPEPQRADSPIIRAFSLLETMPDKILKPKHQPKQKNLHFLYNQEDLDGNLLSKSMPVRVTPGAYPVYYVVARTNGRFGKYPIKSFHSPQAFAKYLQKSKLDKLPPLETFEEKAA